MVPMAFLWAFVFSAAAWAESSAFVTYCTDPALTAAQTKTLQALFYRAKVDTSAGITKDACEKLETVAKMGPGIAFGGDQVRETKLGPTATKWSDQITDISVLPHLPHLRRVTLSHNDVFNLAALRELPELTDLVLRHVRIVDLDVIGKLDKLAYLDLLGSGVQDLAPLKNLTKLTSLGISHTGVTALAPLGQATLARLTLLHAENMALTDWNTLSLPALRTLYAGNSGMADLSFLKASEKLTTLSVDGNKGVVTAEPLAALTSLTRLNLANTGIRDVKSLSGLTSLERLTLDATEITDLAPLAALKKLKYLSLRKSPVKDFTALKTLLNLEVLDVRDGEATIEDLAVLRGLEEEHSGLGNLTYKVRLAIYSGTPLPLETFESTP